MLKPVSSASKFAHLTVSIVAVLFSVNLTKQLKGQVAIMWIKQLVDIKACLIAVIPESISGWGIRII